MGIDFIRESGEATTVLANLFLISSSMAPLAPLAPLARGLKAICSAICIGVYLLEATDFCWYFGFILRELFARFFPYLFYFT